MTATAAELTISINVRTALLRQYTAKVDLAGKAIERLRSMPVMDPEFDAWHGECRRLLRESGEIRTRLLRMAS